MNLWILDSFAGVKILYKSKLRLNLDEDLVSGLLSAFNQFTVAEFKDKGIESIEMGGFRWVYLSDPEHKLLFVAADAKNVSTEEIRAKLNIIKQEFIKEYKEIWEKRNRRWDGDMNVFKPFLEVIENYFYDWEEAEIVSTLANFFDLLGVFQIILNMVHQIVKNKISGGIQDYIYQLIEDIFIKFKTQQDIKDDLEVKKLNYSRESGFTIVDINPSNCDPIIVKEGLIKIIIDIVNVIKESIGKDSTFKHFRKGKIFNYIFDNMELLKGLNLDTFFLKLFLLL